ncbi:MAG: hypothetical protein JO317_06525, partial [Verrucomicrobiae bacterium]|nr:hypothetical protein [Verrucomicrobiae bacterium]
MNEVQLQDRPPPSRERADSDAPEPIWWRRWFVPPEHPRPLRPVLRSLIGASGALSLLAGALVMIGWHAQKQMLVQVAPAFEPTPYNMGMALLIAGAALLLLPLGLHRLGTTFAAIVTGVGSLTVLEHFTGWDFRIDQLLLTHYFVPEGGAPGRMSIYSAIGITLIGVGALLMHQRSSPWRRFWIATCGSILLALGTVALVGYTMGLTTTYDWGYFTRVSVQGAVVFVLVAATFLIYAWQARDRLEAEAPRWLPLLMGVGVAAGTLYLWQTLFHQERALFDRTMQLALSGTKDEIEARLETRVLTLENTAKRWEIWGHSSR